ncbi:hypothetical protein CMEL01_16100, partial [Colletotrichum melonis]
TFPVPAAAAAACYLLCASTVGAGATYLLTLLEAACRNLHRTRTRTRNCNCNHLSGQSLGLSLSSLPLSLLPSPSGLSFSHSLEALFRTRYIHPPPLALLNNFVLDPVHCTFVLSSQSQSSQSQSSKDPNSNPPRPSWPPSRPLSFLPTSRPFVPALVTLLVINCASIPKPPPFVSSTCELSARRYPQLRNDKSPLSRSPLLTQKPKRIRTRLDFRNKHHVHDLGQSDFVRLPSMPILVTVGTTALPLLPRPHLVKYHS